MPKPEIMLYDDAHRWTYETAKSVRPGIEAKYAAPIDQQLRRYRSDLRQAERFYIDDDFLNTALLTSHQLKRLPYWINLARLPFDNVWFEWDCHEKVRASVKNKSLVNLESYDPTLKDVPRRAGVLMKTIDHDRGTWICSYFMDSGDYGEGVLISPLSWIVAPEGDAIDLIKPPAPYMDFNKLFRQTVFPPGMENMGFGSIPIPPEELPEEDRGKLIVYSPFVERRINFFSEPLNTISYRDFFEAREKAKGSAREQYNDRMKRLVNAYLFELQEEQGLMRFMVAVLALLNEAPNVRHYHAPHNGFRSKGMNRIPYLGHSTVHLELPKSKPLVYLGRLLDRASDLRRKNRAHMVRGHWRQIEQGERLPFKCDHQPTMVEDGVGICLRCERLIKWIHNHQRGDASLGWVNHDYVLESSS